MRSQSTAKTIFLLASMVGWLIIGAALIYLCPAIANQLVHSDVTALWIETLGRSNYRPGLALGVCGVLLGIEGMANWIWYRQFDGKIGCESDSL